MFKIDRDRMRVLFTFDDRDLAIALADLEGYNIVGWSCTGKKDPSPIFFNEPRATTSRRGSSTQPEQVSQGVYSYKIALKTAKTYAQGKRKSKLDRSQSAQLSSNSDA